MLTQQLQSQQDLTLLTYILLCIFFNKEKLLSLKSTRMMRFQALMENPLHYVGVQNSSPL